MKLATTALVLAIAGTIGSLFLSLFMGLKACPLCFYQRTFIMAAAVLAISLIVDRGRAATRCLLILPLAIGGLGWRHFTSISSSRTCSNAPWRSWDLEPPRCRVWRNLSHCRGKNEHLR